MNLFSVFEAYISHAVASLVSAGLFSSPPDLARVVVEPTRDANHGDISTNAAMVLQKEAGIKPRDLAEKLATKLRAVEDIDKVEVAGPGFINLTIAPAFWSRVLASVLENGVDFGRASIGGGRKLNVEFVSANPTGPMHVGHCRGAVVGDALAGLLAFAGYDITREYYINDGGGQVDTLGRSAYLRYREAIGEEEVLIPEGYYPGDYLKPVGEELKNEHGHALLSMSEEEWLPIVRRKAIDMMMALIREDLALLNVHFDVFTSERSMQEPVDKVAQTVEFLRGKGDVYEGRLPPPKGQKDAEWEDREQTLFRATDFGDDVDRALMKSDGSYTYFASDIAYHKDKYDRGFAAMIDVLGADHGGYVKRMQAAVKAITSGQGALDVRLCQLVRLLRDGEPVKMSKRSGEFVTLRDVVEEVGSDAVRFIMLMRKNDAALDFDLARVVEQSKDNPVFYVQYAHARCRSIFSKATETFADLHEAEYSADAPLHELTDEGEMALLKRIAQYPRLVEQAAHAHEPHRIAFYLYELASELHAQFNRGKDLPHLRFVRDDNRLLTGARLALVRGVETVLKSGLALLGVNAPDEMR